jgi:hypothetical protein
VSRDDFFFKGLKNQIGTGTVYVTYDKNFGSSFCGEN